MRALGTALLLAGLLTGCGASAATEPPRPEPSVSSAFNTTDRAWLQLMVPMDEQLLRVLALADKQAADPAVRRLAASITVTHRAELAQLIALRDRSGAPSTNVHAGHDMPGMMTGPEILALSNTKGAAFDRLLVKNLREHVDQSALVARSVATAGQEPAVKKLAGSIQSTRAGQRKQLAALG
ncbi:hypothetical protein Kfla_2465 [Kribbella flavida DSM 17836]|uniref:DUF305 domain-containing protein n=1 Tax=Kribbella flavida (strain DSM 17836 / JCM 10339 / NBRC 14399) TaxID=479435 RepID=D2PW87_KRIFD|nr:DUF305 domain-containing protein [Kribbella flavida]ADB31539.1 hypothetical protein Kfla_2465 [Kribbella flavida DSM 17836]